MDLTSGGALWSACLVAWQLTERGDVEHASIALLLDEVTFQLALLRVLGIVFRGIGVVGREK